jgi:charged multivesicular body protein 4
MSFFGFFGKSKKAQEEAQAQEHQKTSMVINNLREQVELMEKRNKAITIRMEAAIVDAKQKLERKDKNGALIALKRKKQFLAEIEKNQGIQIVLENQIYSLESVTMQKSIVDAMALGNKSIKKLNTELNPEKIEELMDEIQEEADNFKSIQDAMSQPLQQIFNDSDLLEELEQLESDNLEQDVLQLDLPTVPTGTMPKIAHKMTNEEEEELEIQQLRDSMLVAS